MIGSGRPAFHRRRRRAGLDAPANPQYRSDASTRRARTKEQRHDRLSRPEPRAVPVGRSAADREPAHRGRADDPRFGARVCDEGAEAANREGLSRGKDRSEALPPDGRGGSPRRDPAGGVRLRQRGLCRLRAGRARGRAGRLRLPLDDERAELARHVSDPRLWRRGAAEEIPAGPGARGAHRLFRPDRAGRGLRPRRHEDEGREDRRRLPPARLEDLDQQRADRRRVRRLGEVGRA